MTTKFATYYNINRIPQQTKNNFPIASKTCFTFLSIHENLTFDAFGYMPDLNMMDMIAKNNFKDYNNVDVVIFKDLKDHFDKHKDELIDIKSLSFLYGGDCSLVINHFLKHSTYHHIFIDEMPPFKLAIPKHDLFSLDGCFDIQGTL